MKKVYEKPEVTKVDFKFEDAIAASACEHNPSNSDFGDATCLIY